MAWQHVIYPIMTHFRRQRLAQFVKAYPDLEKWSVLDVGGRPFLWELLKQEFGVQPKQLVLLNTPSEKALVPSPDYSIKIADGCRLPYEDDSFDLVFSNSVIEHVGGPDEMQRFARECDRVGRALYIQTPNRGFPLEAHFGAAFIHWLPRAWYKKLSFISLRYLFAYNNPAEKGYFEQEFNTTQLLSLKQLQALFPDKAILAERVLGFAKSFVVVSSADRPAIAKTIEESGLLEETVQVQAPKTLTIGTTSTR